MALFRRPSQQPSDDQGAWPDLQREIEQSASGARILPVDPQRGQAVRERLGVSERSTLGALAAHTGGLVLDGGWLRILGGGSEHLPDIARASEVGDGTPPHLIVAQDVLGGRFAVDGGGLGIKPGEVCYWGPDSLEWTGLGSGHSAFVSGALSGALAGFYADLRWDGWESETAGLALDQGISLYPPPFTAEGKDLGAVSRKPVPYAELLAFYAEMARQLST